jgi:glucokinase
MTNKQSCVFACDMGGTYIKAACILEDGKMAAPMRMIPSRSDGPLDGVLGSWKEVFEGLLEEASRNSLRVAGIGVSTPGPFDYKRKTSLMQHKFSAIYGINLEEAIRKEAGLPGVPFLFFQDANSFLAGEQRFGAARGVQNCACVTLGTGLGFAVMAKGQFLTNGREACYIALYRQPWGEGIIEDMVSARGIIAAYKTVSGQDGVFSAKEVGVRAKEGDRAALEVMYNFGAILGRGIGFHLMHTYCDFLVIGGQISKDFPLFEQPLKEALRKDGYTSPVAPACYPEDAALYGAAAQILNVLGGA